MIHANIVPFGAAVLEKNILKNFLIYHYVFRPVVNEKKIFKGFCYINLYIIKSSYI